MCENFHLNRPVVWDHIMVWSSTCVWICIRMRFCFILVYHMIFVIKLCLSIFLINVHIDPECWICYDKENPSLGPLITPCTCKGDVAFVHHECLRRWMLEVYPLSIVQLPLGYYDQLGESWKLIDEWMDKWIDEWRNQEIFELINE